MTAFLIRFVVLAAISLLSSALFVVEEVCQIVAEVVAIKEDHYTLTNRLYYNDVSMTYDCSLVEELGAAFTADYNDPDPEEGGLDAYLNGAVGGRKINETWQAGNKTLTGMPVRVGGIEQDYFIKWRVSQENAFDAEDRWWATINVIFDNATAGEDSEPAVEDRLFDIVIQADRYEQDPLTDLLSTENKTRYWWFARESYPDGDLIPFVLNIEGSNYEWGVRFKFFQYAKTSPLYWKNDKVHVKFIPVNNNNVAPYIDQPLNVFIDAASEYIQYLLVPLQGETPLTDVEISRVNAQFDDLPNKWLKTISAGYEVYQGAMILHQHELRTYTSPCTPGGEGAPCTDATWCCSGQGMCTGGNPAKNRVCLAMCGNGIVEGEEQCDGTDMDGTNCDSLGFSGGTLACDSISCTFDTSGCVVLVGTTTTTQPCVSSGGGQPCTSTTNCCSGSCSNGNPSNRVCE